MHDEDKGCLLVILSPILLVLGCLVLALIALALYVLYGIFTAGVCSLIFGFLYFALTILVRIILEIAINDKNILTDKFVSQFKYSSFAVGIWVAIICFCNFVSNFAVDSEIEGIFSSHFNLCKPLIIPLVICCISTQIFILVMRKFSKTYSEKLIYANLHLLEAGQIIIATIIMLSKNSYINILPPYSDIALPLIFSVVFLFVLLAIPLSKKINIHYLYSKGDKLYKDEQYDDALECYEQAYKKDNSTTEYYCYSKGIVYYKQKRYNEALASLNDALAQTKKNTEKILLAIIDVYTEQEKIKKCIESFDVLISSFPEGSNKYKKYQSLKKEFVENIDIIKQERRLSQAKKLYEKGLNHKKSSEFYKAIKLVQDAIRLAPDNEEYKNNLIEIQGLYEKEKIKIDDLYNKVVKLKSEKQYQQALNVINEAVKFCEKQSCDVTRFDSLKDEISEEINKLEKAKELYHLAIKSYKLKDYSCTMLNLQNAIQLGLDSSKYNDFLSTVQNEIDEISTEVNSLYIDSIERKDEKDYNQALYFINEAIKIAREKKLDTSKYVKYKNELTKYIKDVEKSEKKYKTAMLAYNNKNYESAILDLEEVVKLVPSSKEYENKLQEVKAEYRFTLSKAQKFYIHAKKHLDKNDFEKATIEINNALNLIKDENYIRLRDNIANKQKKMNDKQSAEKLYSEAQILYNSNSTDLDKVLDSLNKAIALSPKKAYEDMFTKVKKENDFITAERLYEEAKECLNNKYFDKGLSLIKQAIKLNPSNKMYIDLKQKIDWEQKEAQKRIEADEYFKEGLQALQDGDFDEAVECFEEVMNLQPNNLDCKTLLDKARIGKIDITTCTENALLTLDFINEEQAENIIQARNNGEMWYDYQKFAEQFEIMPHLWADVEEKIEFPLKQANKYGRRLDW